MEKKKALLIAAGGRAAPDVLPLFYLQPQVVVAITSEEGWQAQNAFVDIAHAIPSCRVEIIPRVNAYDLATGKAACRRAIASYPDTEWEWTFTIGSSPKITGIAAYEVAKEMGIPCWHIDTRHEKVVSLVRDVSVDKQRFFHLSLDDYMKIQRREGKEKNGPTKTYRKIAESWIDVAEAMANFTETTLFTSVFYRGYNRIKNKDVGAIIQEPLQIPPSLEVHPLVHTFVDRGLLRLEEISPGEITYYFTSIESAHFLGTGDWLEVYVWHKTTEAKFADDYRWGYKIHGQVDNEIDLALVYKAQLIIVECKTDFDPFKAEKGYQRDLDDTAELLGGAYVSKVFVTNQPAIGDTYPSFERQADERRIVVVTRDKLADVGNILKNEAMNPTYERH